MSEVFVSVWREISKPDEATLNTVMWLLSVIIAVQDQLIIVRMQFRRVFDQSLTAIRDKCGSSVRVGPGLRPSVDQCRGALTIIVCPRGFFTVNVVRETAEQVRPTDGRVE